MARRSASRRKGRTRSHAGIPAGAAVDTTPLRRVANASANDADHEAEALSVTHWFQPIDDGEPYTAVVRFSGHHVGAPRASKGRTSFQQDERVEGVLPGNGPLAVTTWAYGLEPGEWTVSAELLGGSGGARAGRGRGRATTLPRAQWSWRRWSLGTGSFTAVRTRWAPLVRLTRVPAVLPGSWPALIALGVVTGVLVQATLLAEAHVGLEHALMIDGLALVAGLIGAKLWYVGLKPRSGRRRMSEGWSVDGLLVAAPVAGIAAVGVHELAIAGFLDASTPALFLGIAIGRLGCFFTGCCAGRFTNGPLGIWSSDRRIGARRVPTQLVESAAALLIAMAALAVTSGNSAPEGAIFVGGLSAYLVARQRLLRIRADARGFSRAASLTALLAALVFVGNALVLVASA